MKESRAEIDFINEVVKHAEVEAKPRVERRIMHWCVQRVQAILDDCDTLPGITHADAAAALHELGVSQERVRQLLAGDRRPRA